MRKKRKVDPHKIRIGLNGGFTLVNVKAYLEQKEIQDIFERMRKADVIGKKLNDLTVKKEFLKK